MRSDPSTVTPNAALTIAIAISATLATSGCAVGPDGLPVVHEERAPLVSAAELPSKVKPYPRIAKALDCIKSTGVVNGEIFVVGAFADSTGKINQVAAGATGAFVPQGGSASYITDAVTRAGGRVVSTYFGQPKQILKARYAINGIFNSLDFGQTVGTDMRIAGIGPVGAAGFAQLSLSIQLDENTTRLNRQMSMIQRPVRFTQLGVGVGRDFSGTLVTGATVFSNQERLQLESLNGPIALGVADVIMKEFPAAAAKCKPPIWTCPGFVERLDLGIKRC
jgi:hypothetical protein